MLPGAAQAAPVVAGFERFGVEAGGALLEELRCANCHRGGTPLPGPVLDGAGSRLRPEFLRRWLASSNEVKPGTTMPHLPADASAVEALTHFLASLREKSEPVAPRGSVERGRHLYHQIGCVACHAPDADYVPKGTAAGVRPPKVELASIPLGKPGEKYTTASLQRFLLDPLAVRPAARMPQVPMAAEEAADLAAYLTGDAPLAAAFEPDARLVEEGRRQFTALACAACHTVSGIEFTPAAKPLAQLVKGGCLDAKPPANVPHYALSESQRDALLVALKTVPAQTPRRMMTALNCYACHARDQRGGPEPGRAAYFSSVGDVDLGDEGRIPPALTGAGAKLKTEVIERVVRGEGAVRPYMAVRMPNFGAAHAVELARLFTEADYRAPAQPVPSPKNIGRNTVGRELAGISGVACIACHGMNGRKSLGVPAIDLVHAPQRLRREWFHAYLADPGVLRPGTRMPSFWPGGKPAKGKGTTEHQIDSIWVYLTELDQSRLPEGMENKGQFELKPADAPIVFRTFMAESMHAIAVGFPQKLHAAFDAKDVRWMLAWRGAFLDAEGTWEERAAPLAEPLGKDVFALAKAAQFDAPMSFGGYRLDARGVPAFLYRAGAVQIEDRIEPDANGRTLRRTLTLRGNGPLTFHPAAGEKIVSGTAEFAGGTTTIATEITW